MMMTKRRWLVLPAALAILLAACTNGGGVIVCELGTLATLDAGFGAAPFCTSGTLAFGAGFMTVGAGEAGLLTGASVLAASRRAAPPASATRALVSDLLRDSTEGAMGLAPIGSDVM